MRIVHAAAWALAVGLMTTGCADPGNQGAASGSADKSAAPQEPTIESPPNPQIERPQGVTPKVSPVQTPVTEARKPPSPPPSTPAASEPTGKQPPAKAPPTTVEKSEPRKSAPETGASEKGTAEKGTPEKAVPEKSAPGEGTPGKAAAGPVAKGEMTFSATLSGQQEVPPVETNSSGKASFELADGGKKLDYEVAVTDLENATMAHLHMAPKGQNGDVVVWLYPPSGPPPKLIEGTTTGKLVSGTVTDDKLVGPLKGKTVEDLVAKIKAGDIYVNVHTEAHPDGELRGQVQ